MSRFSEHPSAFVPRRSGGFELTAQEQATIFAAVAAVVSVVGVSAEFWRGRDYFMDKRIRDKAARAAAAEQETR